MSEIRAVLTGMLCAAAASVGCYFTAIALGAGQHLAAGIAAGIGALTGSRVSSHVRAAGGDS